MFETTKFVLNNLNHGKYVKNCGDLCSKSDEDHLAVCEDDSGPDATLEKLAITYRVNNLNVFLKGYLKLRTHRFLGISLPAMLTVGCIMTCSCLHNKTVTNEVPVYTRNHRVYDSTYGELEYQDDAYYYEEYINNVQANNGVEYKFADDIGENNIDVNVCSDDTVYEVSAELDNDGSAINMKLYQIEDVGVVKYNDAQYQEMNEEEYDRLLSNIMPILKSNDLLSYGAYQKYMAALDDDTKRIIIDLIDYEYVGNQTLTSNVSYTKFKAIYIFCLGVYLAIDFGTFIGGSKYLRGRCADIKNNKGVLQKLSKDNLGLFYGPQKYKAKFVDAEKERIYKMIAYACEKYRYSETILTKTEKKLVKNLDLF